MLLELNIVIKYKPGQYPELDHPAANTRLRKHLSALGFLHPKPANVHFTGGESAEFFWITERNSRHLQNITQVFHARDKNVLQQFFIERMEMSVKPYKIGTRPSCLPPGPLLLPAASTTSQTKEFSNGVAGDDSIEAQVQEFLDGLRLHLPNGTGAAEDAEMDVVESSHRASSIASTVPSLRDENPAVQEMDVEPAGKNSQVVEEMDAGSDLIVDNSQAPTPKMSPVPSPIPGLATLPGHDMARYQTPPREIEFVKSQLDESKLEEILSSFDVPPVPPNASPPPVIHQLSLSLIEIRKEVAADLIKEQAILQALKNLDAPAPDCAGTPPKSENDFIAKVRLEMLKTDLENALARRRAVEESVRDIAKERRPPFVCPALMDAFVGISRLSTDALKVGAAD